MAAILKAMKSVFTIGVVRHDTDILETCLRHAASFADGMLLRLHRPTPALRTMARALREEGLPLHLSESTAMHYDQEDPTSFSAGPRTCAQRCMPLPRTSPLHWLGGRMFQCRVTILPSPIRCAGSDIGEWRKNLRSPKF